MARGQRQNGAARSGGSAGGPGRGEGSRRTGQGGSRPGRRGRELDNEGIIPVLARAVREVETAAQRGRVRPSGRTTFQVVALLVREERARIKADATMSEGQRAEQLKRLDGLATILAKTAARDTSLLVLLAEDATVSDDAKDLRRQMQAAAGLELPEEEEPEPEPETVSATVDRRVVPQSVVARQLSNPFLAPDFSAVEHHRPVTGRLGSWELLGPLFRSFEYGGASSCMDLPEPGTVRTPPGMELMHHQAQLVESAAQGHRTFLLADEPGLGKTAQALLAAQAADAYPLLVVVPNVVKTNWAREAQLWTPEHPVTVVHGNGEDIDGFADIVVVNYEVLDRHVGWLGNLGFRGMVVDEAHFIKNKTSQRSQHVLQLSERIRTRTVRPLLMALTGTPLINDIEDFRAIWQFLGWVDDKKPLGPLMHALEQTGLTPADPGFYAAARTSVIEQGIVRRRKVDVASDIPARRIADLPVELDDEAGRSIRAAERELARRLVARYDSAMETRRSSVLVEGIDHELVRRVARWEREDTSPSATEENVFGVMRRIGQAKAGLAADYAAQLARSVGKVVFFAKHIDVMDVAEETFAKRGLRYSSIRGDQTPRQREAAIKAFVEDPDVAVVVCSLTAAGVGLNLQVASNVVLAELSWTDAEQTQAIDRVHRIGQGEPVTAWRIIAAQTIDPKVAQLIDGKAGLAARALDGSDEDVSSSEDIQLEALVALLTEALEKR
ncbi:DEAD/DEAH box helicase [Pedococcus ginsenosidimutans]|uniref:DEAD/DEAH box helicase n=1 Tax=Pedococcus ginsenosidimutans TaxID=490570 RepID=UPI003CD0AA5C